MDNKFINKKLLFCVSKTIPYNAGSGRNAYNYGLYLASQNMVKLLAINDNVNDPFKTRLNNLLIIRLPYFNKNLILKLVSFNFLVIFYIYYILTSQIIFIYGKFIGFELFILLSKIFKRKVVYQSTLPMEDDIKSLINQSLFPSLIAKHALKKIDLYHSINKVFTESYISQFPQNATNIYFGSQGVSIDNFFPVNSAIKNKLRRKYNIPVNTIIIISVGYLIKRKGYDIIFESLNKLNSDFLYLIIGDYHVSKNHYACIRNTEMSNLYNKGNAILGNKIKFLGATEFVQEYLQLSDIFTLFSSNEGFPNAVLEAMASGIVPVINSTIADCNNICKDNENSIVVENRYDLTNAFYNLMQDEKYRSKIGNNAYKTILNYHSFQKIEQNIYKKLYNK